jgi:hypothetical protein
MKAVCEALGVSRSNLAANLKAPIAKPLIPKVIAADRREASRAFRWM